MGQSAPSARLQVRQNWEEVMELELMHLSGAAFQGELGKLEKKADRNSMNFSKWQGAMGWNNPRY